MNKCLKLCVILTIFSTNAYSRRIADSNELMSSMTNRNSRIKSFLSQILTDDNFKLPELNYASLDDPKNSTTHGLQNNSSTIIRKIISNLILSFYNDSQSNNNQTKIGLNLNVVVKYLNEQSNTINVNANLLEKINRKNGAHIFNIGVNTNESSRINLIRKSNESLKNIVNREVKVYLKSKTTNSIHNKLESKNSNLDFSLITLHTMNESNISYLILRINREFAVLIGWLVLFIAFMFIIIISFYHCIQSNKNDRYYYCRYQNQLSQR
jgi:hypothetical protein